VINSEISEHVKILKYLQNTISNYGSMNLGNKANNINQTNISIRRNIGRDTSKATQLRLRKVTAAFAFMFRSEMWILNLKNEKYENLLKVQTVFLRSVDEHSLREPTCKKVVLN
jgi:hypothetical protein